MSQSSRSTGDVEIVLTARTPLGFTVTLDRDTFELKVTKHGAAWVNLEQCQLLFEDPSDVFESQHQWAAGRMLMFYRPANITTPDFKYVRGIADLKHDPARVTSVYPTGGFGTVGTRVYPLNESETTDVG